MVNKNRKVISPSSGEESLRKSMEITREDAVELNAERDKLNAPPLENGNAPIEATKEAWNQGIRQAQAKKDTTLEDVHKVFSKWLFVDDTDRIDIALAVGINYTTKGAPIWIFLVSPAGDWKSELLMSFTGLPNVIQLDQITKNTLASGLKDTVDLGSQLTGKRSLIISPDLANLISCGSDDKKMIWSQFRELYDGRINKMTGSGTSKKYDNCYVNFLAGATPVMRGEYLIHQAIGTRELLYDCDPDPSHNKAKMEMAWENEDYEEEMRAELRTVVYDFCLYHKPENIKVSKAIREFLNNEANHLSLLRATGDIDWKHGELRGDVTREIPTRLIKQLKRIYIALKSLDPEYPDSKAKRIIRKIITSSGSRNRQRIIKVFKDTKMEDNWLNIANIRQETRLGRMTIKAECEQLWSLGSLKKEVRVERIGSTATSDIDGYEVQKGGLIREVDYYAPIQQEKPQKEL